MKIGVHGEEGAILVSACPITLVLDYLLACDIVCSLSFYLTAGVAAAAAAGIIEAGTAAEVGVKENV